MGVACGNVQSFTRAPEVPGGHIQKSAYLQPSCTTGTIPEVSTPMSPSIPSISYSSSGSSGVREKSQMPSTPTCAAGGAQERAGRHAHQLSGDPGLDAGAPAPPRPVPPLSPAPLSPALQVWRVLAYSGPGCNSVAAAL